MLFYFKIVIYGIIGIHVLIKVREEYAMLGLEKENILEEMIEKLDLPEYVIQKATNRYESLGRWFNRDGGISEKYTIEIFAQGSFALGTTIRPIDEKEEYDLDVGCKLKNTDYKSVYSQKHLKEMIGEELEAYRKAKGINNKLESKHRCWRLDYQDEIKFHLDVVPCIAMTESEKSLQEYRMNNYYSHRTQLNSTIADFSVNITDDRHESYEKITNDWPISNPQGYLLWFQERMNINKPIFNNKKADITPIQVYKQKSVLQRCIQLLKRHRDNMFGRNESKPISIIITTLAARSYNGETDLSSALLNILNEMPRHINTTAPRIPNPVNPEEDFSDRWDMAEHKDLDLEGNFRLWLMAAKSDFTNILQTSDKEFRAKMIKEKLVIAVDNVDTNSQNQNMHGSRISSLPKNPAKPWGK